MQDQLTSLLLSILFAVIASIIFGVATPLFKKCTQQIGEIHPMEFKNDLKGNLKKLINKYFILGAVLQLLGWFVFLMAISRYDISVVTPLLAITYIVTAIYASIVLKEKLSKKEIFGIIIIIIGVVILTFPFNLI